ncbi:hypothetical protein BaRGS_00001567 [Batillaria attramentaria]|uniref:Uncharacterized protein n=1 Tax=Batillaria attramentaria TaxID=370345 RepID=A0ABD0M7H5_9CAEN
MVSRPAKHMGPDGGGNAAKWLSDDKQATTPMQQCPHSNITSFTSPSSSSWVVGHGQRDVLAGTKMEEQLVF